MPETARWLTLTLTFASIVILFSACKKDVEPEKALPVTNIAKVETEPAQVEPDNFGIPSALYNIEKRTVRNGESLSTLLSPYSIGGQRVVDIVQAASGTFNVRSIMSGRTIHYYVNKETEQLDFMVYQPDNRRYVVFDLHQHPSVFQGEFEQTRITRRIEGEINGSLYVSLIEAGGSPALVSSLSNVYAWQVDFYRIQRGDRFTVVYDEILIDDEVVGTGRIHAAQLIHRGRNYDAFYFEQGDDYDYFDMEGNSLRKAFLRAPLEYSRISSRFTNRRFHPVLGRNMPHHGTDYAAPTGTPIRAVGDGQLVHAGYDRNNGNYIRIRHNSVYETGYLHMSRLASGMRRGATVKQGQIIGYVGSTGLATGPHLCFRFWQNKQPVDPYRVDMPASNPVEDQFVQAFELEKTRLLSLLFPDEYQNVEPAFVFVSMPPVQNDSRPLILLN